jgi:hypothetical protein
MELRAKDKIFVTTSPHWWMRMIKISKIWQVAHMVKLCPKNGQFLTAM